MGRRNRGNDKARKQQKAAAREEAKRQASIAKNAAKPEVSGVQARNFLDYGTEADICTWVNALKEYLDTRKALPIYSIRLMVAEGEATKPKPRTDNEVEVMTERILEELVARGVKEAIVQMKNGRTEHVIYTNGLKNVPCAA